jgi:hypothetical protein
MATWRRAGTRPDRVQLPPSSQTIAALVATAQVVDVIRGDSMGNMLAPDFRRLVDRFGEERAKLAARWWSGPFALVLDHVRPLEPILDVKGALYFWELRDDHEAQVRAQLARAAA